MKITLKRDAVCKDCGAAVKAGSLANWYRNGDVYGIGCHSKAAAGKAKYNYGVGERRPQEDYMCSDRGYEEQMERAYERANGRGW